MFFFLLLIIILLEKKFKVTKANIMNNYNLEMLQADNLMTLLGALPYFELVYKCNNSDRAVSGPDIYNWMTRDLLGNLNANFFNFSNSPVEPSQVDFFVPKM